MIAITPEIMEEALKKATETIIENIDIDEVIVAFENWVFKLKIQMELLNVGMTY